MDVLWVAQIFISKPNSLFFFQASHLLLLCQQMAHWSTRCTSPKPIQHLIHPSLSYQTYDQSPSPIRSPCQISLPSDNRFKDDFHVL